VGWKILNYIPRTGKRFVSSPKYPNWKFGPPSFLLKGYRGLFLLDKAARE
jgi:hypothetical protein